MGIIEYMKTATSRERKEEAPDWKRRKQFNVEIEPELVTTVKDLAKMFRVPRYCIVEHALQIAFYYIFRAIENEEKSHIIERHLVTEHLCDFSMQDEESIVRIGEETTNWILLPEVKNIIAQHQKFKHAIARTNLTGDMAYLDKCKRELDHAALRFADCIVRQRLRRPKSSGTTGIPAQKTTEARP